MNERTRAWVGVVLVGLLAVGALASTAGHADTTTNRLVSSEPTRDATYSDAGYTCLEAKGHQLIRSSDRVYVAQANLNSWVILTKVLGGWAHLQEHRAHATVAVVLVTLPPRHGSTGQRQTLVTIRTTPFGRVVMTGGSARELRHVSTSGAATVTLLVLALAGVLPVLALVGARLVALPLFPLAGAVLGALSAACCIAIAGTLLMWFVIWSTVAAALGAVALIGRPGSMPRMLRDARREMRPLLIGGGVVVVGATVWSLRTLRVPNIGFDTRSIWLLHARWLASGHALAFSNVRNHFFVVSHPSYPPLLSSVMALTWSITGTTSDRVAVVSVALLNGCALVAAAWGIVEAARRGMARTQNVRWRQRVMVGLGIVMAALVVLVAGGVLGVYATNGYADPLWALAAVGAVLFGLMLEPTGSDLGVAAIFLAVAGLTKVEGTAVAVVLLLVIGVRRQLQRDRPGHVRLRPVLAIGSGVAALLGWELLTIVLGVPTDPSIVGRRDGSLLSRAQSTWDQAEPHLHVVVLAALCALLGLALLRTFRGRLGVGNDLWAWGAMAGAVAVLGGAYVFGPGNIELWLATSVNRTTIFLSLMGWWIVAAWGLTAASTAVLA